MSDCKLSKSIINTNSFFVTRKIKLYTQLLFLLFKKNQFHQKWCIWLFKNNNAILLHWQGNGSTLCYLLKTAIWKSYTWESNQLRQYHVSLFVRSWPCMNKPITVMVKVYWSFDVMLSNIAGEFQCVSFS